MSNKITHVYIQDRKRLALRFQDGYEGELDFSGMDSEGITLALANRQLNTLTPQAWAKTRRSQAPLAAAA